MSATVPPVCLPPRLSTRLRAIRGGGGVVGGTGLVFWNSCSRRWARLECGNRLRTRTFMETCCWRRRRRPEGSQRLEQRRRRRRRRPDPCPHPGAGPHTASPRTRGQSLVVGSRRVRGVRGAWGRGGGAEVLGLGMAAGAAGRCSRGPSSWPGSAAAPQARWAPSSCGYALAPGLR